MTFDLMQMSSNFTLKYSNSDIISERGGGAIMEEHPVSSGVTPDPFTADSDGFGSVSHSPSSPSHCAAVSWGPDSWSES